MIATLTLITILTILPPDTKREVEVEINQFQCSDFEKPRPTAYRVFLGRYFVTNCRSFLT